MSISSTTVLIIGSEGFIGRNIVSALLTNGYKVWGADLMNIRTKEYHYFQIGQLQPEFDKLFKCQHFDYCINAAGSASVRDSITEPDRDFEANIIDTFKLLNAIRVYNKDCKYVHFSSAAVYGDSKQLPISEMTIPAPISPYGYHKWISEITCREFVILYKIPVTILRPFSAYGPGLRKQLMWELYQKFKKNAIVCLHGTGNETRDFVYIDDIVHAVLLIIRNSKFKGEVFNIASGHSTTIKEVSQIFKNILGTKKEILFDNVLDYGNPLFWEANISKISSLGFQSSFTLEKGLEQTIQWLKKSE